MNFLKEDIARQAASTKIAERRIQVQDFKVCRSQRSIVKRLAMVYLITSRYKLPKKTFCPGSNSKSAVAPLAFEIADLTPGSFFCIIHHEFASVPEKCKYLSKIRQELKSKKFTYYLRTQSKWFIVKLTTN